MKKAALFAGILAASICGTTLAAVISGVSAGSGSVYPTPVPAQYVAASYGSALANESIAAGTDSALYCAMDNLDGTTSTPECGLNAIRHKGVGPFSTVDKLSSAYPSVLHQAGDFWGCFVFYAPTFPAIHVIAGTTSTTGGWQLRALSFTMALDFQDSGGATTTLTFAAPAAGKLNHVCIGRSGTTAYGQTNGGAVTTGNAGTVAVGNGAAIIGLSQTSTNPFTGQIFEATLATGAPSAALFNASWAAATTCRNVGRCLPSTANEVMYLNGDQYTIGGSWCGDYPTCSASKTFTRTGTVATRARRYSWPALSWAQAGTVPRVATSGIHRQGYGARHAGLSGWSVANYLSLGSGLAPDVLDFSGDFSLCASFMATSLATAPGLLVNSTDYGVTNGYAVFMDTAGNLTVRIGNKVIVPGVVKVYDNNALCIGRVGTTIYGSLNGAAAVTTTGAGTTPGTAVSAKLGIDGGPTPFVGNIYELTATTTPGTGTYLTFLTDAAMRCTTQGNCFPRDANTVMHCNGDEFTGSVLRCGTNTGADDWTTNGTVTLNAPDFYRNIPSARISAPGAGPYSVGNYFALDPLGTGEDALDFPGSFLTCAAFDSLAGSGTVLSGGYDASTNTGWAMTYVSGSGKLQCVVAKPAAGAASVDTSNDAATDGSLNLGCCGWDADTGNIYALLNASAVATAPGSYIAASGTASYIGRRVAAGAPLPGRVYEILALNKAPTTAQLETIQRRWLNHQSLTGRTLSNTHTIDSTLYTSGGVVAGAPPQAVRIASPSTYHTVPAQAGDAGTTVTHLQTPGGYIATSSGTVHTQWPTVTTGWYTNGMTVTQNAGLAPDGTMTAMTVRETTANSSHMLFAVSNEPGASAGYRTGSFFIRPYPLNWDGCLYIMFYLNRSDTSGDRSYVGIDLRDLSRMRNGIGGLTTTSSEGAGYEILKDGWLRVWFGVQAPTSSAWFPALEIRMHHPAGDCFTGSYTYVGDPNYGFDLWYWHEITGAGPQLIGRPASSGTRTLTGDTITVPNPLRPSGSDWTNALLQSEDLATTWSGVNTAVLANSALAPDSSFTADKLYENDATNGVHYTLQAYTATAVPWTVSFKAKPAERSWLLVSPDAGASTASFDLSTCAAGAVSAGVTSTAATSSAPGWCDFSLTKTMAAGATSVRIFLCTAAGSCSYAGAAGSGAFLWGLQAEPASVASPYCPTTTAARTCGPGGATGKTVTNLHFNSENVASWSRVSNVTPSLVSIAGPASTMITANRITEAATVGTHFADNNPTVGAATNALSFEMKPDTRSWIRVYKAGGAAPNCYFDLATPTVGTCAGGATGAIQAIGNGWVRGQVTLVSDAGARFFGFDLATADNTNSYAGDGTSGLWMRYFQREEVAVGAGPYCGPTAAASRTCAPTQRWCVRVKDATPGYGRRWDMTIGTVLAAGGAYNGANSWNLQSYGSKIYFDSRGGDAVAISANANHTFAPGSTHTIVACMNDGVAAFYYDGSFTAAGTGPAATLSNWPANVFIGSVAAGVYSWRGTIGTVDMNSTGDPRDFVWDRRTP